MNGIGIKTPLFVCLGKTGSGKVKDAIYKVYHHRLCHYHNFQFFRLLFFHLFLLLKKKKELFWRNWGETDIWMRFITDYDSLL